MALAPGACAIWEKLHSSRMARRSLHPFDLLAERFAQIFAERVSAALPVANRAGRAGAGRKLRGRKRDMRCGYPGCKNRSKGPRFRFCCEEPLTTPRKKQDAARVEW